jgi:hypothetical protein
MSADPYTKRELDMRFREILEKLDEHNDVHKQILDQVIFTNGKVKKVILFLTALAFYVLGVSGIGLPTLVDLII